MSDHIRVWKPIEFFNVGGPNSINRVLNLPYTCEDFSLSFAGVGVVADVPIDIDDRIDKGRSLAKPLEDFDFRRGASFA
jgi:hypothetical protein